MNIAAFAWDNFQSSRRQKNTVLVMVTQGILAFLLLTLTMASATIQNHLSDNLETLLGADVVVESEQSFSENDRSFLDAQSEAVSETLIVPITLTNGDKWQRIELKVVDGNYPVQGNVSLSESATSTIFTASSAPSVSEIWIDTRLASHLQLAVGDQVTMGDTQYRVGAILRHEPDRILEGHSIEMRAIIRADEGGQALNFSGQAKFRYLINASSDQRIELKQWSEALSHPVNFIDRHAGGHPFAAQWERIENFLGLTFVLLFFMAAIAISLASRPKLVAAKNRLALLLSMGLSHRRGLMVAFVEWLIEFFATILPALLLAYLAQGLIQNEMASTFAGIETTFDIQAVLATIALLFFMFLSIQIPMFIELSKTSILSLIRGQSAGREGAMRVVWIGLSLAALAFAYTDNWLLTAMVIVAMTASLAVLIAMSFVVLKIGALWGKKRSGLLPFVFFVMKERLMAKSTQIIGLGLSVTLLLSSLGLMHDLNNTMNSQMRSNNGNLYVSDIAEPAVPNLRDWAAASGSEVSDLDPFVHASLVRINDLPVESFATQPSEARTRLERPIRLSWSEGIPDNNRVTNGDWWRVDDQDWAQVSVEGEVMTDLGLDLGDRLSFQIGEERHEYRIVSSHVFKAGGTSTTFWFRVPEIARSRIAAQTHYMGGVESSDAGWDTLSALLRDTPELHVVPLREITERIDATFALVRKATIGFSAIILALSVLVIIASVSGFEADDKRRNGLFLSMGLSNRDCLRLTLYEWTITALIAALGSVAGTWLMGTLVYSEQLSLTYDPSIALYVSVTLATVAAVVMLGLVLTRSAMSVSVRQQLHEA